MTDVQAYPSDRGLQPERTALAWTRTALSVGVSGVLILFKDRSLADLGGCVVRLGIASAAAVVALVVFTLAVRRRHALEARPLPEQVRARGAVLLAGISVVVLTLLVVTYLVLGAR